VASLEFYATKIIPILSMNLLACYLAYLGGATASMAYMGSLLFFEWFSPILPNPHWTLLALVGTIAPAIGFVVLQDSLITPQQRRKMKRIQRKKDIDNKGGWTIAAVACLFIVFFSFGLLGVEPTVIYSGSMQPQYEVGDIVIVDSVQEQNLLVGDIIQYIDYDNTTRIIHRLVDIYEEEGTTYYVTKGDANDIPDFQPITKQRILGKAIFTIPKLGWVQILLKSLTHSIGLRI
jgi:signal peptidase